MAESRKLNGSKAWDGYYLSYAKGYLCDEVNHYKTLTYADESTYHIHAEQESQDEVLKSGFSLQKLVSTTGQPSPALKLEGAGFTVYRISKLSKTAQFKQNPDGSYNAQSILDAYRKDNYDNATLKYDFTAEGQAIANMYESSTETVNAYNATLTADGDHANGKGNGWMPTDQPAEYRLGEMFTNDEGIFRVEGLPYGQYLVVETTIPKDVFQCDPFIVTVDANSPQSRFTVPAGCVTTATNNYMTYNVLDEELEGYLQLIKTDTETGKAVKIANTAFALYRLDEKDRKTRISMIDPASGSATKKTDVFYTDADGLMKTPEKLPLGRYLIEELQGPEGYYNDPDYSVEFEIKSDRVWQVVGNATDDMDGRFSARRSGRDEANHTKNSEVYMKLNHNKKSVKISLNLFALYAVMVCGIVFALPAFAASDPLVVVENLSTFIFSLIRAVGLILLGWGIVQVGLSLQSHDPSQRSQGFLTLAGGLVITFAKEILDLITA